MKQVLALTAGVLVALAPTGTAFAAEGTYVPTVPGKAYGNCGHSSKGGNPDSGILAPDQHNKGNGGLVTLAKNSELRANGCVAPSEEPGEKPVKPVYDDFAT